jgi:hypothetical protein
MNVPYRTDYSVGIDVGWAMLHEFLTSNRAILIDRCRDMVGSRSDPKATQDELVHGIPTFLDQLIETLTLAQTLESQTSSLSVRNARGEVASDVGTTAALHGRDLFHEGFTIEQVVRDYGDVCQAVTNLAVETGVPISVDEFRTFNRCLDNAIAGAVTEYAKHTPASNDPNLQTSNSRLGPGAQELRNHLNTAILAVTAMRAGSVGTGGATAAVLDQSLIAMRDIIDRSLA